VGGTVTTRGAIQSVVASILTGEHAQPARLVEAGAKKEVEAEVKKYLNRELDGAVVKELKKALKTDEIQNVIISLVADTLAKWNEILFTRKSTWTNQLKKK
jgi:hypothetical protein